MVGGSRWSCGDDTSVMRVFPARIFPRIEGDSRAGRDDLPDPDIAASMRAVRLHRPGGPEALALEQIATPSPRAGEALVRVHAAAITRDELEWPVDRLPAIPSYELSGVVAALGQGVEIVAIGEPVYALIGFDRDGAAADYTAVPAALLAPKPRTLGHLESAAVPLAALERLAGPVRPRWAAGGPAGADPRRRRRGRAVRDPARPPPGRPCARDGLAARPRPRPRVRRRRGARRGGRRPRQRAVEPVDLVFDTVGGERLERSPAIVRDGGRLVSVAEEPSERVSRAPIETRYFVVEPDSAGARSSSAGCSTAASFGWAIDSVLPLEDARAALERASPPASVARRSCTSPGTRRRRRRAFSADRTRRASMTDHAGQAEKARRILELHQPGRPLLLPNPWDRGSARLLAGWGSRPWPPPAAASRPPWGGWTGRGPGSRRSATPPSSPGRLRCRSRAAWRTASATSRKT